jgi:hypothetical protein
MAFLVSEYVSHQGVVDAAVESMADAVLSWEEGAGCTAVSVPYAVLQGLVETRVAV